MADPHIMKKWVTPYKAHISKLKDELQELDKKRSAAAWECFRVSKKIKTLETNLANKVSRALLHHLSLTEIVELCLDFTDLGFCLSHKTYFPRSLECLLCSTKHMQKHCLPNESLANWHCYKLAPQTHPTHPSEDVILLNEERDFILIRHLEKMEKTVEFQVWYCTTNLSSPRLSLYLSQHYKHVNCWLVAVVAEEDFSAWRETCLEPPHIFKDLFLACTLFPLEWSYFQ